MVLVSLIIFFVILFPVSYLLLIAFASVRPEQIKNEKLSHDQNFFAIAIPAHDEEKVIQATINQLWELDYPRSRFDVHIVADHCSDKTALLARQAGAVVHERNEGPRTGKGAALTWLFRRILKDKKVDAVVVFDSDTRVDPNFLRVMNSRLVKKDKVIQGNHVIINPEKGWFPTLTWAMFLVDNRFQNLGRSNLGWSAKHMGDSICLHVDVIREMGWGEGLTEDYQFRQRLLLKGIKIVYEPRCIGYGEAPLSWNQAQAQRARWLRGTHDSNKKYARRLLVEGIKNKDFSLLDGAFQAYLPSYSTLSMISALSLLIHVLAKLFLSPSMPWAIIFAWALLVSLLVIYPLFGLVLENAPARAYFAILSGPVYIVWRSWLAYVVRYKSKSVQWIRTAHGER